MKSLFNQTKKITAIMLACVMLLCLLSLLCACDKTEPEPTGTVDSPVTSSQITQDPSPVTATDAPTDTPTDPPATDPPPTDPPPSVWTPQPEDMTKASQEAKQLVISDMWAINFLINLTMDGVYIFDDLYEGLADYPVSTRDYQKYDDLIAKLDSIYISEEAYESFFLYPIFGLPQIYENNGLVYVYPHYFSNFASWIDVDSVKISELTEDSATFTFRIFDHEFFRDGSMTMTLGNDGWRLDQSFFFYIMQRLDVLDIESTIEWDVNPLLDPDQNVGSAKRLTGKCMFYNVFIDDPGDTWDDDSIAGYYEMQDEAFRYLEEQAALFGRELVCYATSAEHALYLKTNKSISGDPDDCYWLDQYLMDTEYGSINGLLDALMVWADDPNYDNYGLLININKQGRSYAIPYNYYEYPDGDYYAERTVIYYSTDYDYEYVLVSATIAHEILHIFGAIDLYYPYDGDDIRKEIIMQYFPFEIMHYIPYQMDGATISAFTAFRVGWRNTLPNQLMMFQAKG